MSDFISNFWHLYVAGLTLVSIIACLILLWFSGKAKAMTANDNTTGHVWDGDLREMNNPLPRWWVGLFIITIVFSLVYLVMYPGVGNLAGKFGWTSAGQYDAEVAKANAEVAPLYAKFSGMPPEEVSKDPQAMATPEQTWRLLARWIGPEHGELWRQSSYRFHALVAQEWRRGRVFLAGDAAHMQPPFLGQGMCQGIRDAANLAWKLQAVLHGHAPDALLDTYGAERLPHVQAFIELAVKLGGIIQTTDPQAARERDARFRAGQPEIFHFPTPTLGPGLWQGATPPAGQVFAQPMLSDGRRLDAALGLGFGVIARSGCLSQMAAQDKERWADGGVALLDVDIVEHRDHRGDDGHGREPGGELGDVAFEVMRIDLLQ